MVCIKVCLCISEINNLTLSERIKLDVWYVEHWNFWLDIKIIFKTVWIVAKSEGLYAGRETDEIVRNEEK